MAMLKMKKQCEKCKSITGLVDAAYICSYECTFCSQCTEAMGHICPNCRGTLVLRPTRTRGPMEVVVSQVKTRWFGD